jgi:SAM-dependent MidA family methyltransferase
VAEAVPLDAVIRDRIARDGPMSVADFMATCLYDPTHGYYTTGVPFGAAGDFVTAPEISQMFGEMVAVWAVAAWDAIGRPTRLALIECGPGRGTLMKDVLRATAAVAPFRAALEVHLVEISAALRRLQRETLADAGAVALSWHGDIDDVPDLPGIVVANEFFDALPVRQAVRGPDGWHERMVALDASGALAFASAAAPLSDFPAMLPSRAPRGAIQEWRPPEPAVAVARRAVAGGAALVIDYGHIRSAPGDTFQAVRRHRRADPLAAPGRADLTAHVDFEALARIAQDAGARVHGPLEQGTFLRRLGIEARAAALAAKAAPRNGIARDLRRLAGTSPGEMGAVFKVVALSAPEIAHLPGFEP